MNTNRNNQNLRTDIPKGRSTSRIKNASQSQGFANKDLYGSSVQQRTASNINSHQYKSRNTFSGNAYNQNFNVNNHNNRQNSQQRANYSHQPKKRNHDNSGEMSESTMVKVIVGSILGAVLLAVIIIVALCFMDFQR